MEPIPEGVEERRRQALTRLCARCGRVEVGATWIDERRLVPPPAVRAMCPNCLDTEIARLEEELTVSAGRRALTQRVDQLLGR